MAKTVATAARVQKVVKKMEKPKPEKPKAKPKMETELKKKDVKKEDPYFVQEDYQVCLGSCSQVLCFSFFYFARCFWCMLSQLFLLLVFALDFLFSD